MRQRRRQAEPRVELEPALEMEVVPGGRERRARVSGLHEVWRTAVRNDHVRDDVLRLDVILQDELGLEHQPLAAGDVRVQTVLAAAARLNEVPRVTPRTGD